MKKLKIYFLLLVTVCGASCKKDLIGTPQDNTAKSKSIPTIVILGSSTAAGTGADPIDSAWANRVAASVNKTTVKANFINLAFGGYTTYDVMPSGWKVANRPTPDTTRNLSKALSYKPALVILSLPSNDIAMNYSDDEILSNYAVITHKLDSAKVQYIIFSTQPRDFADLNQRMRLKTINDKIIAVYSYRVNDFLTTLSTSTYSIKPQYSAGDGIHLNDAGHAIIANATLKDAVFLAVVN